MGKYSFTPTVVPRICDFSLQSIYAIKSAPLCMIGILPLIIKKTRPIYNRAGQKCGNNGRAVSPRAKCNRTGASAGVLPLGTRRGAAVTGTAKERCGVAKPWPRSGQTAPGRFARRNAAPDFAQKPSKPGRPARCPHGPRYGPAGVHRMFLRPPLGLPFSSWRQLRTKMRTISSTS